MSESSPTLRAATPEAARRRAIGHVGALPIALIFLAALTCRSSATTIGC